MIASDSHSTKSLSLSVGTLPRGFKARYSGFFSSPFEASSGREVYANFFTSKVRSTRQEYGLPLTQKTSSWLDLDVITLSLRICAGFPSDRAQLLSFCKLRRPL